MGALPSKTSSPLPSVKTKLVFAGRRFHAWWEGFAFDHEIERAAVLSEYAKLGLSPSHLVAQTIWGQGRLSPGTPAWTMRFARMLNLPVKANIVVLGAEAGAPLNDLRHGTKWKAIGFTRTEFYCRGNLLSYGDSAKITTRPGASGAIGFFELSTDADPSAFARIANEKLRPGAKAAFVDFAITRPGAKLRSCFPANEKRVPRTEQEYVRALENGGFSVSRSFDLTAEYLPMVSTGWAGWRRAYHNFEKMENIRDRADVMRQMGTHAHIWAERFDAMKSGQLRVICIEAVRS